MSTDREAFEAWMCKKYPRSTVNGALPRKEDGDYYYLSTQDAWELWQAAIAGHMAALESEHERIVSMLIEQRDEARAALPPAAPAQPPQQGALLTDERVREIEASVGVQRWRSSDEEGITFYPGEYRDFIRAIEADLRGNLASASQQAAQPQAAPSLAQSDHFADVSKMMAEPTAQEMPQAGLWAEIHRLRAAIKGPDGYDTWQEAAVAERVKRVKLEQDQDQAQLVADAARWRFLASEAYEAVIPHGNKLNGKRTAWLTKMYPGESFADAVDAALREKGTA